MKAGYSDPLPVRWRWILRVKFWSDDISPGIGEVTTAGIGLTRNNPGVFGRDGDLKLGTIVRVLQYQRIQYKT
jgi:hypothetical protein